MNEAKIARISSGLNAIARKVLDAVPAQAIWTKTQIHAELRAWASAATDPWSMAASTTCAARA